MLDDLNLNSNFFFLPSLSQSPFLSSLRPLTNCSDVQGTDARPQQAPRTAIDKQWHQLEQWGREQRPEPLQQPEPVQDAHDGDGAVQPAQQV